MRKRAHHQKVMGPCGQPVKTGREAWAAGLAANGVRARERLQVKYLRLRNG